jgi:hypothetical protein
MTSLSGRGWSRRRCSRRAPASSILSYRALHATWTAEAAQVGWTPERLRRSTGLHSGRAGAGQERRVPPANRAGPAGLAQPAGAVPGRREVAAGALLGRGGACSPVRTWPGRSRAPANQPG